jgi:hypothetical protein
MSPITIMSKDAPVLVTSEIHRTELRADIATGLADVAAGRVKDFDAPLIVERGREILAKRRRFQTSELSDEEAKRIASSRMAPPHDHLNKLLDPKEQGAKGDRDAR